MQEDESGPNGAGPKRESTRDQILEAARKALIREGFERITTRRIADEAGVNIATLHYHFGKKEALLTDAVRYGLERNMQLLRAAVEAAPDAPKALHDAFEGVWRIVRERAGVIRYDLAVRGLRNEGARETAAEMYAGYRRVTEEIFERHLRAGGSLAAGVTVEGLAHYVVAAVDGVVLQHAITGDDAAARASLGMIERHALTMMGAGNGYQGNG